VSRAWRRTMNHRKHQPLQACGRASTNDLPRRSLEIAIHGPGSGIMPSTPWPHCLNYGGNAYFSAIEPALTSGTDRFAILFHHFFNSKT
jgi:hypothetical protein